MDHKKDVCKNCMLQRIYNVSYQYGRLSKKAFSLKFRKAESPYKTNLYKVIEDFDP